MFAFMMDPNLVLNQDGVRAGEEPTSIMSHFIQPQLEWLQQSNNYSGDSVPDNISDILSSSYDKRLVSNLKNNNSATGGYYPSPSAQQLNYLFADLSDYYGMDKVTAYNEAMANTAYQRAVADMQLAGLNPASLFSAGRASVAGSGYASSGGYSSARGSSERDGDLPGWIFYGVSGLAQVIGTMATKNPYAGFAASQVAQSFMRAFNDLNR